MAKYSDEERLGLIDAATAVRPGVERLLDLGCIRPWHSPT
jgi:hypothetical protein